MLGPYQVYFWPCLILLSPLKYFVLAVIIPNKCIFTDFFRFPQTPAHIVHLVLFTANTFFNYKLFGPIHNLKKARPIFFQT